MTTKETLATLTGVFCYFATTRYFDHHWTVESSDLQFSRPYLIYIVDLYFHSFVDLYMLLNFCCGLNKAISDPIMEAQVENVLIFSTVLSSYALRLSFSTSYRTCKETYMQKCKAKLFKKHGHKRHLDMQLLVFFIRLRATIHAFIYT